MTRLGYFGQRPHVFELLSEYYDRVDFQSPEWRAFRGSLPVDHCTLVAGAGVVGLCRVRYLADRSFEFDDDGLHSVVVEAIDSDGETVLDLVAWPLHRPDKFAPALRRVRALSIGAVDDPATYIGDRPLKVFRTPLAWLRAGYQGVVIVDQRFVYSWLTAEPGPIAGEDLNHARDLARLLRGHVDPTRILAPLDDAA